MRFSNHFIFKALAGLMITALIAESCNLSRSGKESDKDKQPTEVITKLDTAQLARLKVVSNLEFSEVLDELEKNDLHSIDHALTVFGNCRADSVSRDSMLLTFNEFMFSVVQEYNENSLSGNKELMNTWGKNGESDQAQRITKSLAAHGINISFHDDDFFLEPDLSFVLSKSYNTLTSAGKEYLKLKIDTEKSLSPGEGQSATIAETLAQQILNWENFNRNFPGFVASGEIQAQYLDLLTTYLSGTEQYPLFDPVTNLVDENFKLSYQNYLRNNPDTESGKIIGKFYKILADKGFKYSEELDTYLSEINLTPPILPQ